MSGFRRAICERMEIVPFWHQAEWWSASDGFTLTDEVTEGGYPVRLPDGSVVCYRLLPRPHGRARVLADLGAFKTGKSFGGGIWAAAFAAIPQARVSLVGLEYDLCAPEFEYIAEALISEKGMNLKYAHFQNRARAGDMYLELKNGARFEAKSWERKDSLKGKEIDAYVFCEAYMLPGLECYTGVSQNLRARQGYSLFATTPDRPWVKILHECGHGNREFPDWHCTCSVPASVNPFTFSESARHRDSPEGGGLMTREKYAIAYEGKLGEYVGRVYNYQRGERPFTRATHPYLFKPGDAGDSFLSLAIPDGWRVEGAADTGTFMAGLVVAFDPEGNAYVLWEAPNYRYVANEPELVASTSVPAWAGDFSSVLGYFNIHGTWADKNTQFRRELINYGISLLASTAKLEQRTEVSRTYFTRGSIFLAPWLRVLPYELENACWPEESTAAGKYERVKRNDHLLDCLEHLLARHPKGVSPQLLERTSWAESFYGQKFGKNKKGNVHLGSA